MDVIHFTQGATDPLTGFDSARSRFVPLADGTGCKLRQMDDDSARNRR
jgi:hypothetical protein